MPFFRKKPVVIEAIQWLNRKLICPGEPEWFCKAEEDNMIRLAGTSLFIETSEGVMEAKVGDWIIRGVKGEIYPCKPDIFDLTYDAVGA
jgi:hypothetical protein